MRMFNVCTVSVVCTETLYAFTDLSFLILFRLCSRINKIKLLRTQHLCQYTMHLLSSHSLHLIFVFFIYLYMQHVVYILVHIMCDSVTAKTAIRRLCETCKHTDPRTHTLKHKHTNFLARMWEHDNQKLCTHWLCVSLVAAVARIRIKIALGALNEWRFLMFLLWFTHIYTHLVAGRVFYAARIARMHTISSIQFKLFLLRYTYSLRACVCVRAIFVGPWWNVSQADCLSSNVCIAKQCILCIAIFNVHAHICVNFLQVGRENCVWQTIWPVCALLVYFVTTMHSIRFGMIIEIGLNN